MSQLSPSSIYLGVWTDWTLGRLYGTTLTLSHRGGTLLLTFTAIFTSFVMDQLWSVSGFIVHHVRSQDTPQSALAHQRQSVLRNTSAPLAAWTFAKQAYYWRGREERATSRSLGWAAIAVGFAVVSGLAATLSAFAASKASINRLAISDNCGFWSLADVNNTQNVLGLTLAMVNDTSTAANYAQTCYPADVSSLSQCQRYINRRISWSATRNATCPFQNGICCSGNQAAYSMMSDPIDSLTDLGINSHPSERLYLQKQTTCSCLREVDYMRQDSVLKSLWYYEYGWVGNLLNFTYSYNLNARQALVGYSLASEFATAAGPTPWRPVPALNRTDADVSIVFISSNGLLYEYPNNDDIFQATNQTYGGSGFSASIDVNTIACAEQYRVCNPAVGTSTNTEGACSPWMGAFQLQFHGDMLNKTINEHATTNTTSQTPAVDDMLWTNDEARLTSKQVAILARLVWPLPWTSMFNAVFTRGPSSLRLQKTVLNELQRFPISDTYWPTEVSDWFELGLARLQQWIMNYATGPSFAIELDGIMKNQILDEPTKKLCKAQLTRSVGDNTINFSVFALSIIYVLGFIIILISFNLEKLSQALYFRHRPEDSFKRAAWDEDGFLQLQKRAFAAASTVTVSNAGGEDIDEEGARTEWTSGTVPVTTRPVKILHYSTTSPSYSVLKTRSQSINYVEPGHDGDGDDWPLQRITVYAK